MGGSRAKSQYYTSPLRGEEGIWVFEPFPNLTFIFRKKARQGEKLDASGSTLPLMSSPRHDLQRTRDNRRGHDDRFGHSGHDNHDDNLATDN